MTPPIPSTQELRTFEVVARYLSFTRAGKELCLSTSAVSKQLHSLEERLGVQLFFRGKNGLMISEAGQTYLDCIKPLLAKLEEAGSRLTTLPAHKTCLHVRVAPAFADRWLFPRFPEFVESHPDLAIQFDPRLETDETYLASFDAFIRFGKGVWPGCESDYLGGQQLVLVANPKLLARNPPIRAAKDLVHFTLLEHSQVPDVWARLFAEAGDKPEASPHFLQCDYYSVIIRGVTVGLGLALVPRCFVAGELAAGDLVHVLGYCQQSAFGYFLVIPETRAADASVSEFREWLRSKRCDGESPSP